MLEGMVPAQARAVHEAAGGLLLYCPIVRDDEIEASLAYLARRLDENTSPDNFLRAMFTMTTGSVEFAEQAERFRAAVRGPSRRVDRAAPSRRGGRAPTRSTPAAVRQRARHRLHGRPPTGPRSPRRWPSRRSSGAAGPDGAFPTIGTVEEIDAVVATAVAAGAALGGAARCGAGRPARARRPARFEAERGTTLALMAAETAKTIREGDPEVSEAIDFARYYAGGSPASRRAPTPLGVVVVAVAVELPVRHPRRRGARRAGGRQHRGPQAGARDRRDGVAARQPAVASRASPATWCSSSPAPTTRSAAG